MSAPDIKHQNEVSDVQSSAGKIDRYLSFAGIACDDHARRIVLSIRDCIGDTARPSHWQAYFETRLAEAHGRGHDDLYVVGSQVNAIRELFEHYGRAESLELLDWIEDECC